MTVSNPENALRMCLDAFLRSQSVDQATMKSAVSQIMDGQVDEILTASFLTALTLKGETISEITGAAEAMIEKATPIPVNSTGLLDTCGTGGDGLRTFNISTAVAIAVAACGVKVAKHGNRSVSSSSGSADVLEALGVNLQLSPEQVGVCVDQIGIGFCFAPLFHQAMKHAIGVRKKLGFRTVFNLLGPLTNPAGATFQLIGTGSNELAEKIAGALSLLNRGPCIVVCGNNELDEISLWGTTKVFHVDQGKITIEEWTASSFGLSSCTPAELVVSGPEQSARVISQLISGQTGPAQDMVLANGAAALQLAGHAKTLPDGVEMLRSAIQKGLLTQKLQELVTLTNQMKAP